MTISSPLLKGVARVLQRVAIYKDHARRFYYETVLSQHCCPSCGGQLRVTGPSECTCSCGLKLDPTVEFQRSPCCGKPLRRARCHYVCTHCGTTAPSRFVFEEKLFDNAYFAERMRQSRERRIRKLEEFRRLLSGSRSDTWMMDDFSPFEGLPGLSATLDECIHAQQADVDAFETAEDFKMESYRQTIISAMAGCSIPFNLLPALCKNDRLDRARHFMTLLFMEQDREVQLHERPDGILVTPHETHI